MPARSRKTPPSAPPPRTIHLYYPLAPGSDSYTSMILFVENGGLRIDNGGPLPKVQVKRLIKYCERYLAWKGRAR